MINLKFIATAIALLLMVSTIHADTLAEDAIALPEGIVIKNNIVYKSIQNNHLALDLYLPNGTDSNFPLLVWFHGGAWLRGSKEEFIHKNNLLVNTLLKEGYAIASVNYRLSYEAKFPSQIQDCNDAINFLWSQSETLNLDKNKIAVMGRSAGAHLASLVATSNSHKLKEFFSTPSYPKFTINAVVNFFGPSDFIALRGNSGQIDHDDPESAEAQLLGHSPLLRPDIAKWASPTTYVDENTPPFIILHGNNDQVVPYSQSTLLKSYLDLAYIENKYFVADGAGHGDPIFDSEQYVNEVLLFLREFHPKE
jgi:acetyl esterase/lipase